jgi:hypothetical protein
MFLFHAAVAFLVAAVYVVVGALRWHHPLGSDLELALRMTAGVLVYGNLLWLLLIVLSLPLRRWPRLAVAVPSGLLGAGAVAFELAVRFNLELPSLVALGDPARRALLLWALALGAAAGVLVGIGCAVARGRRSGLDDDGAHRPRGRRAARFLLGAQLLVTLALVGRSAWSLGPGSLESTAEMGVAKGSGDRAIALFCIDAGMWTIADRFIAEGAMPHLAALKERGSYGHLITHGERLSPVVWTSMVTGMAERNHGIHGFTEIPDDGTRKPIPTPSTSRSAAALWNVADAAGLRSLVLNWLITAPPEPIDGIVICDLKATLAGHPPETHPPAIGEAIALQLADGPAKRSGDIYADERRLLDITVDVYEMASSLGSFDLIVTGTQASDAVMHRRFLHAFPEGFDLEEWKVSAEDIAVHGDELRKIYGRLDEWLGAVASSGRAVLVVSDHGARGLAQPPVTFRLNAVLADLGLIDRSGQDESERVFRVDPEKSRVFEAGNNALENQVGFFFQEEVEANVAPLSREEVFARLRGLCIRETGAPLFARVVDLAKEAGFPALRSDKAAGVVILASVLHELPGDRTIEIDGEVRPLARYVDVLTENSGTHDPHGMFLFAAPGVPAKGAIGALCSETSFSTVLAWLLGSSARIDCLAEAAARIGLFEPYSSLDVAPTVLAYLGLPVAEDMDGRIMARVLAGTDYGRRAVPSYADLQDPQRVRQPIDEAAQQEMMDQLRNLGYVR